MNTTSVINLKAKLFIAIASLVVVCAVLAGCAGGNDAGTGEDAATFQGNWVLSGGTSDGVELTAESIDAMEQLGMNVYMQLNEGGSAILSLFGTNAEGTWQAKDATTVTIDFEGSTIDATLEDGELVMAVDGSSLRFTRGEIPPEATAVQRDEMQQAEPEA